MHILARSTPPRDVKFLAPKTGQTVGNNNFISTFTPNFLNTYYENTYNFINPGHHRILMASSKRHAQTNP